MTGEALKLVAVACMLIDHVAWAWVPTGSVLGVVMHCVGRVTMPVMAFMVAQGYEHTHDVWRYALRLAIFAVASDIPYMMFERSMGTHDVMFTLLFGLVCILIIDKCPQNVAAVFGVIGMQLLAVMCRFDWSFIGVLLCLICWRFRSDFMMLSVSVLVLGFLASMFYGQWWQMAVVLALPLLRCYNGERGRGSKWGFYAFYPGHLAALAVLRAVV